MNETPVETVRSLYEAIDAQDELRVRPLVHPDARVEMMMANGVLVKGRDAVVEMMKRGWGIVFRIAAQEIERLDANTFLITGRIRVPTATRGFADRPAVWITEWSQGTIIRQRLYPSVETARAEYTGAP